MIWEDLGGKLQRVDGYTVGTIEKVRWEDRVCLLTMENAVKERQHMRLYPSAKAAKEAFNQIAKEWQ